MYRIKEIKNMFDLSCYDNRKSFYGKAQVIETPEGRYLKSYDTLICFLSYGGSFEKLWEGYSATTQRHINSFLCFVGWSCCGGKALWDKMECGKRYTYAELVSLVDTRK